MISVCIPYWERRQALARLFDNYMAWYAPTKMQLEFSVCDDGSPTQPAELPPADRVDARLIRLPTKSKDLNPCVPINRAVANSTGPIIVLTNPEIVHESPVLEEMQGLLTDDLDYIAAPCWCRTRKVYLAGGSVDYTKGGRLPVPPGAHFHFLAMFTRVLWERAGGFDEDYRHGTACDDNDFLWRLHRAGAHFKLATQTVYHYHQKGFKWSMPHNRELFYKKWPEARDG